MPRLFDGVDDRILMAIGGNNITAPNSFAAIVRRAADGDVDAIYSQGSVESTPVLTVGIETTNSLYYDRDNSADFNLSTFTVTAAEGWVLVAGSKASGTVVSRFHKYVYGTNAWTHADSAGTCANPASPGAGGVCMLGQAKSTAVAPFGGDMEIVGTWNRVLTDGELENLPFSLQNWYASDPVGLWLLDQSLATQNIADLTGNGANQTAITGTAIATNHSPVWNRGHSMISVTREAEPSGHPAMRRWGGIPRMKPGPRSAVRWG